MLEYLNGELYKIMHRKYLYVLTFLICCILLGIFRLISTFNGFTLGGFAINRVTILGFANMLAVGINVVLLLTLPIFTDDTKNDTAKNLVTVNLTREEIYLIKYVAQLIVAVIIAFIIGGTFFASINLLPQGNGYSNTMLIQFYIKVISAFPCFAAAIAMIDLLAVMIKNDIIICLIYYYGYIQVYSFVMFIFQNNSSFIVRIIAMPAQVGNLFTSDFSLPNCFLTILAGFIHIVVMSLIFKYRINYSNVKGIATN